jgi:Kef-type K+ transport systems, membrane components
LDEETLLLNMALLLLVAGVCSVVFKKLKMPPIVGYLAAGIILGSYWMGTIPEDTETVVDILADMGLVLLMFCIGMELNLKKLRKTGVFAIVVALVQLPLMILGGYMFGILMGWTALQAIFFGAIISGSSTAVVTAVLRDQGKLSKDDVEAIILITVVEDVAQVLILSMASPLLVGSSMGLDSIAWMLIVILIFMAVAVVIGMMFIPRALDWIAAKMPDETLWITSLGICFAMALMSVWIGMSMAIGAFLIGVVVSQANSKTTIEHDITPMKDIFMAMFFISVGMVIAPSDIIDNIIMIIMIFLLYAALKISTVFLGYFIGNKSVRLSFMSAVSLVAMGEFAFIIAKAALDAGVVSEAFYTSVIGAALVSMVTLPILSNNASKICDVLHDRAPKPLVNAMAKAETVRADHYAKISLSSKSTAEKMKTKAAFAYIDILLIFVIELVFFLFTNNITNFLYGHLGGMISYSWCQTIVLSLNFLALSGPLYDLIKNLKFVERVLIDVERKAEARGEGNLQRRSMRFYRAFISINNWAFVFVLAFVVLLIVPNEIGFMNHMVAVAICAAVILFIYIYKRQK